MLAFCYSLNSDVSMLLRRCGLFSIMVLSHDLKMLTKKPKAKLNENQRMLLKKIGRQILKYFMRKLFISYLLFQLRRIR